jgi:hypothetical protein
MKFLHFAYNNTADTNTGAKKLIFQNSSLLEMLKKNCPCAYLPAQGISADESLALWKGLPSFNSRFH